MAKEEKSKSLKEQIKTQGSSENSTLIKKKKERGKKRIKEVKSQKSRGSEKLPSRYNDVV
jgi:hypothetical protein